jgi:tetratricopeptide (TPR) repeat protein
VARHGTSHAPQNHIWLRAVARYQQEKIDSAIEDFKQAALINSDPPDIIMYMAYAEALLKKGAPKDALRQIDEALKRG